MFFNKSCTGKVTLSLCSPSVYFFLRMIPLTLHAFASQISMCATQSGTENYFLKPEVFASKVVRVDWTPSTSGGDYQLSNVAVLASFDFVLVSR